MATEKIIMVDRIPEKLSDEEMKKIREDYAAYCVETYKFVQNLDISNKDAKDIAFQHVLSPFQYFVEDKVRLMRDRLGRTEQPQGGVVQQPTSRGPTPTSTATQQQYRPKWKKY
jgi:hypothetical protein